ncbi:unnamed protein product [Rotaria sp. Silwood1]|nr:unnamed protein product [Rotaria sp. Silwood1]CAF1260131.1 unnamed protein product [Rotaria sp. Silwood1]CAF3498295.1 unnamed protein product [Rotaria sp. Silwood1]CAF3513365.1 unnamed protein product [Rotaria sp. Silwood1]CAF4954989.1 unnamed protein product [Rotaria sp. Silwood1]
MVDLLDIPNSISRSWSHIIDQSTENHNTSPNIIFVLGNKVDRLPKGQCSNWICGIEERISKIFRYCLQHSDVYLLGDTNAGKSSLFNNLIDSDLCHIHAFDCIQRATVSNLSSRTMNVLRFPIQLRTGKINLCMINKCSNQKELSFFDYQSTVSRSMNILLDVGETILIGGIARIDVKYVSL